MLSELGAYQNCLTTAYVIYDMQHNHLAKSSDASPYCKYNDQIYQLCISCLYLAAAVAAILAEILARKRGRKVTLLLYQT